ncbi:chromosome partition protein MukB [Thiococcus pfennigii]|uniref:chromosome partition protein MukB n=1 Tax=Thiococcus pfennigii TaxID=1057 RepID=UPI001907BB44|nr:chromosome partition protein MukB [Thiococcus pfennigii]MBK1700141.1 chromosome partition protein MukB [Thiococcus pfennigii]
MIDRARIERLLLLNWKGIFFQPFELHEAVTALEGENGAGKTTVMIGAFVALLPDLQRLAFRNVGEATAAGDGDRGIYGRLGEKGPSYSLLDLRAADGSRVVAGVCLLRGAPPRIELQRFLAEGLPWEADLEGLVLVRDETSERIPEIADLRQAFARAGAGLTSYDSAGRYCGRLHELGILPMRMEQPQDRQRYHHMLHTSMYGGFSGSLQKGLREYLLNEDQKLRNHVGRMRENLDACRVTRGQIAEAQARYKLIEEVFRFGWGMAEAAFHGSRLFYETRRTSADAVREQHRRCCRQTKAAQFKCEQLEARHQQAEQALEQLRRELDDASKLLDACTQARHYRIQLDRLIPQRAQQELALRAAAEEKEAARERRDQARARVEREQLERDRLAKDLSRAEEAFESVSRRVGLYRAAVTALGDARAALPDRELELAALDGLLAECEEQWKRALNERSRCRQELEGAEARRARFDELLAVVCRLSDKPIAPSEAAAEARRLDAELRDLADRVERARDLPERIAQAESAAGAQARLRQRLATLLTSCGPLDTAAQLHRAHAARHAQRRDLERERADLKERCVEHRYALKMARERITTLDGDLKGWQTARDLAQALTAALDRPLEDAAALNDLGRDLESRAERLAQTIKEQDQERKGLIEEAERLEFGGGRLEESLVGLADRLEGRLLSELFDDTLAADAARIEARLGPLHRALLVPDAAKAARQAVAEARRPDDLWLVEAGGSGELTPSGETIGDSELVQSAHAWRLSRHPARPVVGRAAREQEIERLRAQARDLEQAGDLARREREQLRVQLERLNRLRGMAHWLGQPSPQAALDAERRDREERQRQLRADESGLIKLGTDLEACVALCETLDTCLPDAALLDQEDWAATLDRLRREREQLKSDRTRLDRVRPDLDRLREGFLDLQQTPLDDAVLDRLRRRQETASSVLDYWRRGRELLQDLDRRRPDFAYADQVPLLEDQQGALEALRAQLDRMGEQVTALQKVEDSTRVQLEQAGGCLNTADAELKATDSRRRDLEEQLAATGEDGSEEALEEARRRQAARREATEAAAKEERALGEELVLARNEVKHARDAESRARTEWHKALVELHPHWRNWLRLRLEAEGLGLLQRLQAGAERYQGMAPPTVANQASEHRGRLDGVLRQADGGADLLERLGSRPGASSGEGSAALRDLRNWLAVRRFLEQSIPRDIVQSDDPEEALVQIGQQLTLLRERLDDQERALRQSTEDIANSVRTRIRQEEARIRGLNRGLARVRFGSIRGVRLHMEQKRIMARLLDAMRTQPDLFEQDAPLEDVMARVYTHIGGGQVKGEQLLDYRQYIELTVQVQRLGSDAWTEARAGALSTGESIGVGAAVLVVILDAWEQQAALLKGRKAGQALRFLFLDEANRLSPDSLDTLTELCQQMRVQLLAAAPAADRARRGHIYRLARRSTEDGREEVVVRGRRMREDAP